MVHGTDIIGEDGLELKNSLILHRYYPIPVPNTQNPKPKLNEKDLYPPLLPANHIDAVFPGVDKKSAAEQIKTGTYFV